MNLRDLNEPIEGAFINWLPKTIHEFGDEYYGLIIPYKDARYDRMMLDRVCGPGNWQSKFEKDAHGLKCSIGVKYEAVSGAAFDWIWKEDYGDHEGMEKIKGTASDSFKRAGFQWGIGSILYEFPRVLVQLNDKEYRLDGDRPKFTGYFKPNSWMWEVEYRDGEIFKIVAKQKFGNRLQERFNSEPYKK